MSLYTGAWARQQGLRSPLKPLVGWIGSPWVISKSSLGPKRIIWRLTVVKNRSQAYLYLRKHSSGLCNLRQSLAFKSAQGALLEGLHPTLLISVALRHMHGDGTYFEPYGTCLYEYIHIYIYIQIFTYVCIYRERVAYMYIYTYKQSPKTMATMTSVLKPFAAIFVTAMRSLTSG